MEWINRFRRKDENTREAWGHLFQWSKDHVTPDQYEPLKYSYDKLGEECYEILNRISPSESPLSNVEAKTKADEQPKRSVAPKRDFFSLLRDHRSEHPKLQQLWDETTILPEWVDWDQIARGQEVFYRYGGATLTGLAFQSLVGGMGSSRVVETLAKTGGFNVKVARHRLFETTQHVLECTKSLESIQAPDGAGFASSLRVRLLHAAVRQRIMKLTKTHPSYYSVEKNGVPINDLDCIATIATFSVTIIFISLPRQGIFLRKQEIEDYVALWRLVALYTGTPTHFFETPEKAKAMMESLLLYEVDPSPTSVVLANNVLRALENTPPAYSSYEFLCVTTHWLNGPKLSRELGIPSPPLHYYALMAGQCLFYMAICYTYRSIPMLDRRKIKTLRRAFWHIIVESKELGLGGITEFGFKYVPEIGKSTEKGASWERHENKLWEGYERRAIKALTIAGLGLGVATWLSWKGIGWVLSRV